MTPNRFRQAGYGFFLGYAVLFLSIMIFNKITRVVVWHEVMFFLLLFTTIGGGLTWRGEKTSDTTVSPGQTTSIKPLKALTVLMLVLMTIHLVFIIIEVFTQPVYPWDAWLAWIYRAKAWFMAGSITGFVNSAGWASANSADVYTIDAFTYPLFPSIIPYWAALSLGRWSETLINLPVLFTGFAIGMALFGQCREHGLSVSTSLTSCYLLYSIPLFGTHLALAGYADIWMAGFNGLGFIALIRGISLRDTPGQFGFQVLLGLSMILFGIWVKNEGAVWFLAALAMLVLTTCRPRVPILMITAAVISTLFLFALGITHIKLPLMGALGIVENRLVIPYIGSFALETHNVLQVYWDNFIEMGSWNLVWLALTACLLIGIKSRNVTSGYLSRRAALSFILIFLATQIFIFGFTDQGLWADTYTAINRLPLHFIPAIIFAIVVIVCASLNQGESKLEPLSGIA